MAAPLDPAIAAFFDALLSPDNAVRQRAEAQKDAVARDNPAALIAQLAAALAQAPLPAHRALAAVLMRRVVGRDTLGRPGRTWETLAPAAREQLKAGMLQAFQAEPVADVRKKICHAVAELATVAAAADGGADWPALLPAVFAMSGDAADPARREASLFMFTTLTEFTGDRLIAPHCAQLQGILGGLIVDSAPAVAVAALKACCAMIAMLKDDTKRNGFQAFVPRAWAAARPARPARSPSACAPRAPLVCALRARPSCAAPNRIQPRAAPRHSHQRLLHPVLHRDDQGARDDAAGRQREQERGGRVRGAQGAHRRGAGPPGRHAAAH